MGITARGIGLLAAAVALLGVGFRYAYPELTVLGAAAAVAVGYGLVTAAWRPRLAVERSADPDRVARGEPASMTLTVRNTGRLRAANLVAEDRCGAALVPVPASMTLTVRNTGRLRAANLVAEDRCGAALVPVPLLRLRPGRDTTVRYDVPTRRRGVVPVGPLRVTRRDPLGLVALARPYGGTVPVWVHPRIHPLRAVPTGAGRSLDGRTDSVPHGSITFDSLREYVVGDELRRVHWRTSARVGELMVRENVDTSLPRIVVVLDNRAAAHPERVDGVAESFESGCEAAASVVAAAVREDLPVSLLLVVPADGDPAGAGGPLDRLAAVELADAGDDVLRTAMSRLRQERLGDTLVFLTGPGGRGDLGQVGALRGAYPSVLVGVLGAAEPTPAGAAGLLVVDAADGAEFAAEWDGVASSSGM